MEFYASCPEGFEVALADELRVLGLRQVRRLKGRVTFTGETSDAYRACLWSRLASRVFVLLDRFDCFDADSLYAGAREVAWEQHLAPGATIAVAARGTTDELRNSHFSALCVKDAICDRLAEKTGRRPDVDVEHPDARILLSLRGERASLHLDLSGDPLFKRLPREATRSSSNAAHVLRPDYAALVLSQAGWYSAWTTAIGTGVRDGSHAVDAADASDARGRNDATDASARDGNGSASAADAAWERGRSESIASDTTDAADVTTPLALVDFSCAGGGIVLEAANMLIDRAPGRQRTHWGFEGWRRFDADIWRMLLDEADERAQAAARRVADNGALIVAADSDNSSVEFARRLVRKAGFARYVRFVPAGAPAILEALEQNGIVAGVPAQTALVADTTEAPIKHLSGLLALAADLRNSDVFASARLSALTRDDMLVRALGIEPTAVLDVMPNNTAACILTFAPDACRTSASAPQTSASQPFASQASTSQPQNPLDFQHFKNSNAPEMPIKQRNSTGVEKATPQDTEATRQQAHAATTQEQHPATSAIIDLGDGTPCPVLVPESEQFARRLRKVAKQRRKWAQREGISCYRVYDADLPDYSAAIDLYEGCPATPGRWLVIAEYAAPSSVDPALAQARMLDMLTIAPRIMGIAPENVFAKARTRSRGGSQYGKGSQAGNAHARNGKAPNRARNAASNTRSSRPGGPGSNPHGANNALQDIRTRKLPLIQEGGLTFAVNFDDYLDTGIFLDHRITRGLVREHARGRRWFLNLFAYTGTATCYAADAGVEETVTVDLSNTYLDWAERNMEQNGFTGPEHHFVRADVLSWIRDMQRTRNRWDLIFCDPPTFSNSSKMGQRTWDVQRDHVELLIGLSHLLTRDGEAIFSCNLRTFRPDFDALENAGIELVDITEKTIPEDFARNKRIHRCYIVRRI